MSWRAILPSDSFGAPQETQVGTRQPFTTSIDPSFLCSSTNDAYKEERKSKETNSLKDAELFKSETRLTQRVSCVKFGASILGCLRDMVLQSQPGLHSDHIEFPARPSLEEDPNGSSSLLETPNTLILRRKKLPSRDQSTAESPIIVCPGGDLILHYVSSATAETYYWKVDRNTLRRQSSYFNVLLDPTRSFIESQSLAKQLATLSGSNVLPIVKLPATPFSELYGIDALELFLQVTFLTSLKVTPLNEGEESLESLFSRNVLALPLSSIARLIAVAQFYQNEASVYQVLKDLKYLEKSKFQLHKFSQKTMKLDEDRIRQTIVIAKFLRESEIVKKSSHALVVSGSTHWTQAPEVPDGPHLPWQFLADGMEGKLEFPMFFRAPISF